jgi:hypothetical protein
VRNIYLDLDGVFADFEAKFEELVGFPYHQDPEKAWSILDKVDHLFLQLEPLPSAKLLFDRINDYATCNVKILTALPRLTGKLNTAEADKKAWVAKYLSDTIEVICTDGWKHKVDYCRHGDILVDDMERNTEAWFYHGGIGIHHSSKRPDLTIKQLIELEVLSEEKIVQFG